MLNVRLAGDILYGKYLFNWLSLVMSLMGLFVLSFLFQLDDLDEIWVLPESVSEGFSNLFCMKSKSMLNSVSEELRQNKGRGLVEANYLKAPLLPVISLLTVLRRHFYFDSSW